VISCTVGVFAHNEAQNVRRALRALLDQRLQNVRIDEIVVVASGCTDGTVELAEAFARDNPLVSVDIEVRRTGKAAAMKRLMAKATGEVIVFVGADTLPAPDAIEHLLAPFSSPEVGMTGARVVPLNPPNSFPGFAVQMLWYVHHHLALRQPKLGELVACRNMIADFPEDTATDDLALEALVVAAGYKLAYAPAAIVYNKGPEHLKDFLIQRRRIFAGELRIAMRYGYVASSLSLRHVVPLAVDAIRTYPHFIFWTSGVMALEMWARIVGAFDALRGRTHVVWRHAASTKQVIGDSEGVTLVALRWVPESACGQALLDRVQQLSPDEGDIYWWDRRGGEMLLRLHTSDPPEEWVQSRLLDGSLTSDVSFSGGAEPVSCRTIRFAPAPVPTIF